LLYQRKSRYYTVNNTPSIFIEVLEHIVKDVIKDHSLNLYQIEGNLQFYGQTGTAHKDIYVCNNKDRTILFYPNLEWNEALGGELEILDDTGAVIDRILPLPGRVVYFDSTITHRALDPCVLNTPRFSIAYRMEKPFSIAG
jgi:Rps23 Pro-64 3,4-dihydroxylase Tpa1-like proline 4-hydroxylase